MNTKQEFHFWGQQMTTSKGLGDAIIELPAVRPDIPPLQGETFESGLHSFKMLFT